MSFKKGLALTATLATFVAAGSAQAAQSVAGGLEFSGYVDVVTGWQHDDSSTIDFGSCSYGPGGLGCNAVDSTGSGTGELGNFRGLGTPNRDTFNFYIDEVELDLQKSFGENIRIRADLDFGRLLSGTPNTGGFNSVLEQGYVTLNVPVGNGAEFLVGRFNAPIGYESVDRINNVTISFSNLFRFVLPHNLTGAKLYYAFSDTFDWTLYVVNNLADTFSFASGTDSAIPSYGTRFGWTFGEEGRESTIGLSYAGGPEAWGQNAHLTHLADLDFMAHMSESLIIAGEAAYRQDNVNYAISAANPVAPGLPLFGIPNSKVWGANILFDYAPSEIWDFWFRYGYIHDLDPTGAYTGSNEQDHTFTVGLGYQITDDAKFKLEYRLDLRHYSAAVASAGTTFTPPIGPTDGGQTSLSNGVAAEFGYQF